jgi:hypothetical protein
MPLKGVHQNTQAAKKPSPTEAPATPRAMYESLGEREPVAEGVEVGGGYCTVEPLSGNGRLIGWARERLPREYRGSAATGTDHVTGGEVGSFPPVGL